jgi:organic hydroperoxide reductase OsmC/OhrA
MTTEHAYTLGLRWTGNTGAGTATVRGYSRDHELTGHGLASIAGSSDPAFRGDPSRWNPEQLFLASLAQCHMLWYLSLAADAGVNVTAYHDNPTGIMTEETDGSGRFTQVTLRPRVTITAESDPDLARALHAQVGNYCFIARSVTVPVDHDVSIAVEP